MRRPNVSSFARSPRFPATGFASHAEFQEFLRTRQPELDVHYAYEMSQASHDPQVTTAGTCAACLCPASFTSSTQDGEKLSDGRRMPNWREQQRCDCADRLIARQRALLHFMQASVIAPFTRLLLFGPPTEADARLAGLAETSLSIRRLSRIAGPDGAAPAPRLDAPDSGFHAVVAQDYLQSVPPLQAALAEIHRVLLPGGRFVFTIPFHYNQPASDYASRDALAASEGAPVEFLGAEHKLGWDLLALLAQAGFRESIAYLYWSEELGYLGSMNFLFRAVK